MEELYSLRGLRPDDAQRVIEIMSQPEYDEFFVEMMMSQELKLPHPTGSALATGKPTYCSTPGAVLTSNILCPLYPA